MEELRHTKLPSQDSRMTESLEMNSMNDRGPSFDGTSRYYDPDGSNIHSTEPLTGVPDKINDLDADIPLGQAMKKFPKIVWYCLFMAITITAWGYSLLITGAINGADSFKKDYGKKYDGEWIIPKTYLSVWLATTPAGSGIGALAGGALQDRIGRRLTLMTGSIISAAGVAGIFFSFLPPQVLGKRGMYTAGMFFQGFSVGMLQTTCNTWVSENSPVALQGPAMAIFPIFTLLGQLCGSLTLIPVSMIEGRQGYASAFAAEWVLAASAFILSWFIPDSPIYMLRRGRDSDALRAARRLYSPKVDSRVAIERFRKIVEEERSWAASATYLACFRRKNLRRTMITLLAGIMPSFFGLDLLASANVFLGTVGFDDMMAGIVLACGIIAGIIANGLGIWILSRKGVRRTTLITLGVVALWWTAMAVVGFFESDMSKWIIAGLLVATIVSLGLGVWPASFAYIGQTSSMQLRAVSTSLATTAAQIVSAAMSFVLPQLFNKDGLYLKAKTAFLYTGSCSLALLLAFFFLPEMRGRTVADLDSMFAMRLPTRQFRYYKVDDKVQEDDKVPLVSQSYSSLSA